MSNSSVFVDFAVSTEMVVSQLALKLFISMPLLVSSSEFCCFSFWWLKFLCGFLFNNLKDLVMLEFRLIEKLLLSCNLLSCFFSSSCSSGGEFSVVGVEIGVGGAVQHNLCSQSPFLMTGVEFDAPMTWNLTHNWIPTSSWESDSRYIPPYNIITEQVTQQVYTVAPVCA